MRRRGSCERAKCVCLRRCWSWHLQVLPCRPSGGGTCRTHKKRKKDDERERKETHKETQPPALCEKGVAGERIKQEGVFFFCTSSTRTRDLPSLCVHCNVVGSRQIFRTERIFLSLFASKQKKQKMNAAFRTAARQMSSGAHADGSTGLWRAVSYGGAFVVEFLFCVCACVCGHDKAAKKNGKLTLLALSLSFLRTCRASLL